jgi:single-stranded-DNA-specific exonuclease
MERAIERLILALERNEHVAVFGDYDVDGVTSAAILTLTLRALGIVVTPRIAKRSSGYGFSPEDAEFFGERKVSLVLTGDCGTSDRATLELCLKRGLDVIVIDHHQVPTGVPIATALINPHRPDDQFPFKGLASCGVAFYLAAALRTRLRAKGNARASAFEPRSLLDLVALGTIADLVPMVEENRILVAAGLCELSKRNRPGVLALTESSGIAPGPVSTTDVSFRIAPRLNAAGRLGNAQCALDLFLTDDLKDAREIAATLENLNSDRRQIQNRIWEQALSLATEWENDPILVLGAEGWHQGVVGIVAAKLVERFQKPAVVLGFNQGEGRGSARTTGGFDLYKSLGRCAEHLTLFGGHTAAAGLSLPMANLAAFRQALLMIAQEHFRENPTQERLEVDAVAHLADLDLVQAGEIERLGPFGNGNLEPLLAMRRVRTQTTRVVGTGHLQLTLMDGPRSMDAIAFGMGHKDPGKGTLVDVLGMVEIESFRGQKRARLRVRHLLRSEP